MHPYHKRDNKSKSISQPANDFSNRLTYLTRPYSYTRPARYTVPRPLPPFQHLFILLSTPSRYDRSRSSGVVVEWPFNPNILGTVYRTTWRHKNITFFFVTAVIICLADVEIKRRLRYARVTFRTVSCHGGGRYVLHCCAAITLRCSSFLEALTIHSLCSNPIRSARCLSLCCSATRSGHPLDFS